MEERLVSGSGCTYVLPDYILLALHLGDEELRT